MTATEIEGWFVAVALLSQLGFISAGVIAIVRHRRLNAFLIPFRKAVSPVKKVLGLK